MRSGSVQIKLLQKHIMIIWQIGRNCGSGGNCNGERRRRRQKTEMGEESAEREKEWGVGGTAQGSKKWILQWPGAWEVQWQGEGRRRYRDGWEVLQQTRRGYSQIPIAGVFNLPPSCLSCRSWL